MRKEPLDYRTSVRYNVVIMLTDKQQAILDFINTLHRRAPVSAIGPGNRDAFRHLSGDRAGPHFRARTERISAEKAISVACAFGFGALRAVSGPQDGRSGL